MNRHDRRRLSKLSGARATAPGEAVLARGLQLLQEGRTADAERLFRRVLARDPREPNALHFLGLIAHRTERYDEAVELLKRGKTAAPDYAELRCNLGMVLFEQGKVAEATAELEELVAVRPDYAMAWANLGEIQRKTSRAQEAARSLQRALAINPAHVESRYRLAGVLLELGEYRQALQAAEACLRSNPVCQHALAYKALAAEALGDRDAARHLVDFERLIIPRQMADASEAPEFNRALEADIRSHPTLIWQPPDKVTRGGSVARDLLSAMTPALRAFEERLHEAIAEVRRSVAAAEHHPFKGRCPERYRLTIIASVLPAGGYHPPHIHEGAWLSGTYYVRMPEAVSSDRPEGWIEFGSPDFPLPGFDPEVRRIQPQAGLALFFPSYFYHGTVPFAGDGERISIAFDVYAA